MAAKFTTGQRSVKTKLYVGSRHDGSSEIFRSAKAPTRHSHGQYRYATGPFRTRKAAEIMAKYGGPHNPHLQTVADAERLAREGVE